MRQFRTCTDSVFDLDLDIDAESPRDMTLGSQPGPSERETTAAQPERPGADPAEA